MPAPKPIVLVGTALALILPSAAHSARFSLASSSATARPAPYIVAQYEGGPFAGPYDGGPYGPGPDAGPYGYGPPDGGPRGYARRAGRPSRAGGTTSYQGFRIVLAGPEAAAELPAVQHQIDIVDNAGLSASDMRLFRSTSIEVTGSGGSDSQRGRSVRLGNLQAADGKPILLHEFMHILHRSKIPGGFNNPTINRFYEEALANNLFPRDSYMMRNRREYFAVTASCYLYGSVERPPYTRQAIAQAQPDYYAYLGRLFGGIRADLAPRGRPAIRLATRG